MRVVNFNVQCKVKLTELGKSALDEFEQPLIATIRTRPDDEGYYRFALWELCRIFGPHITFGADAIPFENNEILMEEEWASKWIVTAYAPKSYTVSVDTFVKEDEARAEYEYHVGAAGAYKGEPYTVILGRTVELFEHPPMHGETGHQCHPQCPHFVPEELF